ncbi:hypothetical protein E4T81_13525 [Barnesiella sp. WM24]|uniref:Ig-like domain-containing protein n=1 Tax=Barnesiella sp. WM24 TaxID=2558278 RepID=UPI0010720DA7|nr:Ig-like domain-containing protein [Barnesiella sp. WM24]TFU91959.1 hypothetical protein E4T81_13525 [Barnesiella sp. WM24]
MKKILLILLITLVSLPHLSAAVGDEFTYDGLIYTVLDEEAKTCQTKAGVAEYNGGLYGDSYTKPGNYPPNNLVIPSIVINGGEEYTVTRIGNGGFTDSSDLTTVELPSTVTYIGEWAFNGCGNLTSINLTDEITYIGNTAFNECRSLKSIHIPNSLETLEFATFASCASLTSVEIPNSITKIGNNVFYACENLTDFKIPNSVSVIEHAAFSACPKLEYIEIPNSVTEIGWGLFIQCTGLKGVKLPDSINSIPMWTFDSCKSLESFEFPESVTSIGKEAFFNCISLTSIDIPESVTSIELGAFSFCSGLTTVTIPNSVTSIGNSTFSYCSGLTAVTIPNSVTSIGNSTFSYCSGLTAVTIPNSVTSIGENAFGGCSVLKNIIVTAKTPPIISSVSFSTSQYNYATLYVDESVRNVYSSKNYWNQFNTIKSIIYPTEVIPSQQKVIYRQGDKSVQLSCTLLPEDVTVDNIYWESSNPDVVSVDHNGLITYEIPMTPDMPDVEIRATTFFDDGPVGIITVTGKPILAESITLDKTDISIFVGATEKLTATVLPDDVTYNTVTWTSSDDTIVKVDEEGNVTAMAEGEATITATCGEKSATCKVTVNPILAESIALDRTELVLTIGATDKLTATVLPEDVTDKTVTWTSSDDTIVTVDAEGNIQALALGEAVITASCGEQSATCKVTVNPILAESIALDRTELVLTIGATDKLTATVLPEDVTDKTVTWTSSDDTIVKVDEEGNIQALALGEATITAACGEQSATCKVTVNPILAESIALDRTELVLTIGATDKLTATVLPEDVTDKIVTWASSDDTIVKVDEEGNIQALALGEAIITATCGEQSATCKVTVNPILAESIALDRTELVLTIGATDKLTATVLPEDVTDKTVTWTSSDDTIVKVDEEGNIQALALGEAIITATCGEQSATCKVTVNPILAGSIALDRTELVLTIGATDKLTATVLPEDVTDKTVTWASSDDTIVKVDEEGNVQALALGEAIITATCGEQSATCKVTVNPILAESIALDRTELVLTIGATDKLTATVLPEDVTDKTVTWTSSDDTIVKVDEEGNIQALALGEATITAACGEKSATCKVTVNPILAESIALDRTELVLTIGATDKLTATVLPEDVTDKTVTWTSSDDTIVKVDAEGNIQALALGEAIITAACGEQSATCKVTVNPILAESIALDRTELVLTIGATDKLTATVLPEDVTDKTVTWTSSDDTIVKVDEDGNVTAIAEGEAVITATCGEVSASCNVTVEGIVTGIVYVENDDINITVNGTELTVETSRPSAKVTIVRQDGAVIYTGENRGSYYLVRGLYIVVVDNTTQKIVIN